MLGHTYRFQAKNETGVSVDVTVKGRRYKFASDGSLSFDAESTEASAAGIANGAVGNGATRDNSSDKWLGGKFVAAAVAASGSPSGNVTIYFQRSTDGGTTWPDDEEGVQVATIPFTATGTKRHDFSL